MTSQPKVKTIRTVDGFLQWVKKLEGKKILYRGLANKVWKVEASARRRLDDKDDLEIFQNYIEKQLLDKARLQGFDQKNGRELSDLELLAELQHYGAATCLMDFTTDPLVALWFACRENFNKDAKVVAIKTDDAEKFLEVTYEQLKSKGKIGIFLNPDNKLKDKIGEFLKPEKIWMWTPPNAQNSRIISQKSVFMFGPIEIEKNLYEVIEIKRSVKKEMLKILEYKHGITENHLFSDFLGFAVANSHSKDFEIFDAEYYFRIAESYRQRQEYEKAEEYYKKFIELKPQSAEAYNNCGIVKLHLDRPEEAIEYLNKSIEINSQFAVSYIIRGFAKLKLGKYEEAKKDCNKAIDLNPQNDLAYEIRGHAKEKSGDTEGAKEDFATSEKLKKEKENQSPKERTLIE